MVVTQIIEPFENVLSKYLHRLSELTETIALRLLECEKRLEALEKRQVSNYNGTDESKMLLQEDTAESFADSRRLIEITEHLKSSIRELSDISKSIESQQDDNLI